MWMGEETFTGKMRWKYIPGSDKPVLQQEWKVIVINLEVKYEWRTVPGIIEDDQK